MKLLHHFDTSSIPKGTLICCSKLVISVTEHLVEVVDKFSTTAVVFFRLQPDVLLQRLPAYYKIQPTE